MGYWKREYTERRTGKPLFKPEKPLFKPEAKDDAAAPPSPSTEQSDNEAPASGTTP
jgi:hypothetical protein